MKTAVASAIYLASFFASAIGAPTLKAKPAAPAVAATDPSGPGHWGMEGTSFGEKRNPQPPMPRFPRKVHRPDRVYRHRLLWVGADCAMRKLAYTYGKQLRPDQGAFTSLHEALDLNGFAGALCRTSLRTSSPTDMLLHPRVRPGPHLEPCLRRFLTGVGKCKVDATAPTDAQVAAAPDFTDYEEPAEIPADAVYVCATEGDDRAAGTFDAPLRTIQLAADTAAKTAGKTVVLRQVGGSLVGNASSGAASARPSAVLRCVRPHVRRRHRCLQGTHYLPHTIELNAAHSGLHIRSHTGERATVSGGIALKALKWKPHAQGASNIYVADVTGQITDAPALLMDGKHATKARYPNLPGGACARTFAAAPETPKVSMPAPTYIPQAWCLDMEFRDAPA